MNKKKIMKALACVSLMSTMLIGNAINANAAISWSKSNGKWYCYKDGSLYKGWLNDNSKWYYLQTDGSMKTGWLQNGGSWYYLNTDGSMKTGWLSQGGSWYYLQSNGAMKTGWLKENGKWYFMQSSGVMKTGWLQNGGCWYYFYNNGTMASNTTIGTYYLNSSGAWDPNVTSSRRGFAILPQLYEMGFRQGAQSNVAEFNIYGKDGHDKFTYFNFMARKDEYDISIEIINSNAESNEKLKKTLNLILPTKANELYSALNFDEVGIKTMKLDERTISIETDYDSIAILFGPIQ